MRREAKTFLSKKFAKSNLKEELAITFSLRRKTCVKLTLLTHSLLRTCEVGGSVCVCVWGGAGDKGSDMWVQREG